MTHWRNSMAKEPKEEDFDPNAKINWGGLALAIVLAGIALYLYFHYVDCWDFGAFKACTSLPK